MPPLGVAVQVIVVPGCCGDGRLGANVTEPTVPLPDGVGPSGAAGVVLVTGA